VSVKIELAAGKVTKVMPWTSPARLTTRFTAFDAMFWVPAYVDPVSPAVPTAHDDHVILVGHYCLLRRFQCWCS
jgi:hypothetical protein